MAKTKLGQKVEGWSARAKEEFRADLDKMTRVPSVVVRSLVDKIAKTSPACNTVELAAFEAEQHSVPDRQAVSDFVAAFTFLWNNSSGESYNDVLSDLSSQGLVSNSTAEALAELLKSAAPFREAAEVAADHLRVGSTLFVSLRGTVDVRLRFHETQNEFLAGTLPKKVFGAQEVIMASLTISEPDGEEKVIGFLMDENDLNFMKKFVRNMEQEFELCRGIVKSIQGA
jgi:hypothetical protein